jgi:hypothetical protein
MEHSNISKEMVHQLLVDNLKHKEGLCKNGSENCLMTKNHIHSFIHSFMLYKQGNSQILFTNFPFLICQTLDNVCLYRYNMQCKKSLYTVLRNCAIFNTTHSSQYCSILNFLTVNTQVH